MPKSTSSPNKLPLSQGAGESGPAGIHIVADVTDFLENLAEPRTRDLILAFHDRRRSIQR